MSAEPEINRPDPQHESVSASAGRQIRLASGFAVIMALLLIAMKSVAWVMTGSVALLGSLLDSVLDFSISAINFFAVRHALTPADHEHRFGHGKAEALAALAQAVIISVSALFLLSQSISGFFEPQVLSHSWIGVGVIVVSIMMTLLLVFVQRRVAKNTGSLAISADSAHYEGDLYMNLAVIVALILNDYIIYADPALGIVVTLILFNSARAIAVKSFKQLMDHEVNDETRARIRDIIVSHPDVHDVHDLRTRRSGIQLFIQAHIELDGNITLSHAHHISDEVELTLGAAFPDADILLHQDPAGHEELTPLEMS
jgi:ferrous-iron efflux pump FieF